MQNSLKHFTAEIKGKRVDMYYKSIKQAKRFNPLARNFQLKQSDLKCKAYSNH